jgi:hypothetical protein
MSFFVSNKQFGQLIYLVFVMLLLAVPHNVIAVPCSSGMFANGTAGDGFGYVSGFSYSMGHSDYTTFGQAYAYGIYSYGVSLQTNPVPEGTYYSPLGYAILGVGEDYYINMPNAAPDQISHFKGSFHLHGTFNAYNPLDIWEDDAYRVWWAIQVGGTDPNLDPPIGIACREGQFCYPNDPYGYDSFGYQEYITPEDGMYIDRTVNFDIEIVGSYARVPIIEWLYLYQYGLGSSANFEDPAEFYIDYSALPSGTTITTGSGNPAVPTPTSSVPEPSTILLLGVGLAGIGLIRRRCGK